MEHGDFIARRGAASNSLAMMRFLIPLVLLTSVFPAQSQNARPRVGEVALEGRIAAFDAIKNVLLLQVSAFSNSSGKSAKLAAPKDKTVIFSLETPVTNAAGRNFLLGDLGVGEEIVAVGRDEGAQLRARLIVWSEKIVVAPDSDTPAAVAPFLPAPQTAFGATLRPFDAQWTRSKTVYGRLGNNIPMFYSQWKLWSEVPAGKTDYGTPLPRGALAKLVRVSGPNGEPLPARLGGTNSSPNEDFAKLNVFGEGIHPKWPFVTMEWEIRDPQAGDSAAGRSVSLLEWENLDFPRKVGEKVAVNRALKTPVGASVELLNIERRAPLRGQESEYLHFDLRFTPGTRAPDAKVQMSLENLTGESGSHRGTSWGGGSSNNSSFNVRTGIVPPDDAGKLKLSVRVVEESASLQDRSKFKNLRFRVPVAPIWDARPLSPFPATKIGARTAALDVQVEEAGRGKQSWNGLLWIRASNAAPNAEALESESRFFLRSGTLTSSGGKKAPLSVPLSEENRHFVRESGEIAPPNTRSQSVSAFVSEGDLEQPFTLDLELEKAQLSRYQSALKPLALPAGNFNRALGEAENADDFFAVRRVLRFADPAIFEGMPANGWRKSLKPGIAIVVELSPLFPDSELEFRVSGAFDASGKHWGDGDSPGFFNGDATRARGENPRFRTIFLPEIGAAATSVSLNLVATETKWSGVKEKVEIKVP